MKDILKYFDALNEDQIRKIEQLHDLYLFWNEKINLISRKEMPYLYPRHILHSLSIARVFDFAPNTKIIDIGTGGGLPGLPLAIYFPQVQFHLVDSIGKKIKVVNELIKELKLENVTATQIRGEKIKDRYDFITSRAVTNLPQFFQTFKHLIANRQSNSFPNGIIYLKGGDFDDELKKLSWYYRIYLLKEIFTDNFFDTKKIVHVYK
ncbi:MAG: 16S rRNA (guanine(527)-N(7))-methyltransferase RsmG [Bacteroidetes bacterium]|nr:MAG: 16S rRNA (guanine(527)-N(7))-methyltransferase RsmG [Bacteroidota bacterium]